MPPANYRRTNPEAVPWYVPKQSQAFKRICYRLDLTDGAHSRLATEGPSEYSCKASDREFTLDHRSPVSHGGKSVSVRCPVLSHSTLGRMVSSHTSLTVSHMVRFGNRTRHNKSTGRSKDESQQIVTHMVAKSSPLTHSDAVNDTRRSRVLLGPLC